MRSLTLRLAVLLLAIVAAAIGVVYLYVVPPLASKLRDADLSTLARTAGRYTGPLQAALGGNVEASALDRLVRTAADRSGARLTLLAVNRGTGGVELVPRSDSTRTLNPAGGR